MQSFRLNNPRHRNRLGTQRSRKYSISPLSLLTIVSLAMESQNLLLAALSSIYGLRYYLLIIGVSYLGYKIFSIAIYTYKTRQRYDDIPHLPRHWLTGNLVEIGKKCNPQMGRHPDYGFEEMWNELGQPSCFMVDLAPVDVHSFLVTAEPQIAEAIVQPSADYKYSIPKSDTMHAMKPLIGKASLITAEREDWRSLRKRFNRGFAPAHLHNLSPLIISKTRVFVDRIRQAAKSQSVLPMKQFAQDLTTDIITQLAIEKDFESQSLPEGQGAKSIFGVLTASRIL